MQSDTAETSSALAAPERQPLAVLAADLVGYTRLMDGAELETYARLKALRRQIVDPLVVSRRGRIVKNTGDGFIATFTSPADAVACAIELQTEAMLAEASLPSERRLRFRIGLAHGEVIVEEQDVYGAVVNVAARLEQLAPPGGVLLAATFRDLLGDRLTAPLRDLGAMELRHIERPVHVLALELPGPDSPGIAVGTVPAMRRARPPSIAVMPFRTLGPDAEDAYLGQGIVDDITGLLAGLKDLLVIARGSTLAFRQDQPAPEWVGRVLGVRYVVDGTVRRMDSRLRITVRLTDGETDAVLWAERYDLPRDELFSIQDKIAERIVWTIAPKLRGAELRRASRRYPESMDAYELVLQAIDLLYRMRAEEFARARPLLERAIELDDGYASAHAYAAKWHLFNVGQGWSTDPERDSLEAARLAAAAVARDPADALALAIQGHTEAFLFHRYDAAAALLDRALTAAPNHALAWAIASGNAAYVGDATTAIARAERALRLSPLDIQAFFYLSFLGIAHYAAGQLDEAVIWAAKTRSLNPRFHANLRVLAASLVATGREEEAREVASALLAAQPGFRLEGYQPRCPWRDPDTRALFIARLGAAGLPP